MSTTKKPKSVRKSRVVRLCVSRLYNCGNYEHVKYDIVAEVPNGGSAKQTMLDLVGILGALRPIRKDYDLDSAREVVGKDKSAMTEYEKAHFEEYVEKVSSHALLVQRRDDALRKLDDIGGCSQAKDAKNTWEDNDELF